MKETSQGRAFQDSVNSLVDGVRHQLPQVFDRAKDYKKCQAKESAVTTYEREAAETQTRSGVLKDLGVKNEKGVDSQKLKLHLVCLLVLPAHFHETDGETQGNALSPEWEATGNGTVKWVGNYENPVRSTLTKYGVNSATSGHGLDGNRPGGDMKKSASCEPGRCSWTFSQWGDHKLPKPARRINTLSDTVTAFADPNYGDESDQ